jgi:hypothetical protein
MLIKTINKKLNFYRTRINKFIYSLSCRRILKTYPIRTQKDAHLILSMLRHSDILNYLCAIKSFYHFLGSGEICILNDGSLNDSDIKVLHSHISHLKIINLNQISKSSSCPQGGCWERILLISELVQKQYVIQLDADTITNGNISEVSDLIQSGTCFTLGTNEGYRFESMTDAYLRVKHWNNNHVQVVIEKHFHEIANMQSKLYVRGSAAFAGFAKESFNKKYLENFSKTMSGFHGSHWSKWGTEQVTSNFIVANSSPSVVLPYPDYADYYPPANIQFDKSRFLHFSGANRYKKGLYRKKSLDAIYRLR